MVYALPPVCAPPPAVVRATKGCQSSQGDPASPQIVSFRSRSLANSASTQMGVNWLTPAGSDERFKTPLNVYATTGSVWIPDSQRHSLGGLRVSRIGDISRGERAREPFLSQTLG